MPKLGYDNIIVGYIISDSSLNAEWECGLRGMSVNGSAETSIGEEMIFGRPLCGILVLKFFLIMWRLGNVFHYR